MNQMNNKILNCLKKNSRMSWQGIGKQVHLTGQAVAARVKQMEDQNIITGYTIRQDAIKQHFISVFMDTTSFDQLESFLNQNPEVDQAFKVTGDGCYFVIYSGDDRELEEFLNSLVSYGRYRVSSTLSRVK